MFCVNFVVFYDWCSRTSRLPPSWNITRPHCKCNQFSGFMLFHISHKQAGAATPATPVLPLPLLPSARLLLLLLGPLAADLRDSAARIMHKIWTVPQQLLSHHPVWWLAMKIPIVPVMSMRSFMFNICALHACKDHYGSSSNNNNKHHNNNSSSRVTTLMMFAYNLKGY